MKTYIAVYIDEVHPIGPNVSLIEEIKSKLSRLKIIDIGQTNKYFAINVYRNWTADTLTITRTAYAHQLLETHQMSLHNSSLIPMVEGFSLALASEEFTPVFEDVFSYKRVFGVFQWIASQSRPEIYQSVPMLSHYSVRPTGQCWKVVVHLQRYLRGAHHLRIQYGRGDMTSVAWCDISWTDDIYTRKSTVGYVFILNNSPVIWSCRKQLTVSTSKCEAEYLAKSKTACEALWIRGLLKELKILLENASPTVIHVDNQGAIKLAENSEYHRKTKHIPIKYHKFFGFLPTRFWQMDSQNPWKL